MRIQQIDPDQAQGGTRTRLDDMTRRFGGVPLTATYLAHSPIALDAFFGMTAATMRALTPRVREQLALFSAEAHDCSLCKAMHARSARRAGLSAEEIEAARRGEATDPVEQAALALAEAILRTHGAADEHVIDEARAAGFDDAGLLEVFLAVTNNLMTNYFNRFAGLTAADLQGPRQAAA